MIEIPGVSDCAVVGVADKTAGELPRAFVVKAAGSGLTVDDIKDHVNPKVSEPKWISNDLLINRAYSPSRSLLTRDWTAV